VTRKKPIREFTVRVVASDGSWWRACALGETFFAARAALATRIAQQKHPTGPDVEPGDIRLDPPRRYEP